MSGEISVSNNVAADPSVMRFRRIVTGLNADGRSIICKDAICPHIKTVMGLPTFAGTELWITSGAPVNLAEEKEDPAAGTASLAPPKGGSVLRVVEFPPDHVWMERLPEEARSPMMHRTATLDYAYVIEGEIYALLDESETLMKAGDVLIQRGTNHAWSNRSDKPCRVLFVLIDAILPA